MPWPMRHFVARIEPGIETVLAEHATSYWGRPLARVVIAPGEVHAPHRLLWTIEGEPVAELVVAERRPVTLVVHDFSVFAPLRAAVRTRHVRVRFATYRDGIVRSRRSVSVPRRVG